MFLLMAEILHQFIGSLSHYLQGFIHPRWCRISAINSCAFIARLQDLQVAGSPHVNKTTPNFSPMYNTSPHGFSKLRVISVLSTGVCLEDHPS